MSQTIDKRTFDPLDQLTHQLYDGDSRLTEVRFENGFYFERNHSACALSRISFSYGQRPFDNQPRSLSDLAFLRQLEAQVLPVDLLPHLLRVDGMSPRILRDLYDYFERGLSTISDDTPIFGQLVSLRIWYAEFTARIPKARFYNPFSRADLTALANEYPDSKCAYCGAFNALFWNRGDAHYQHHEIIRKQFGNGLSLLTYPMEWRWMEVEILESPVRVYGNRCLFCLLQISDEFPTEYHHHRHYLLHDALDMNICTACNTVFKTTTQAFCHFLARHLSAAKMDDSEFNVSECKVLQYKEIERSFPTRDNHYADQIFPSFSDYRSIPIAHYRMKTLVWRDYQRLMKKRGITKNDSGSTALEILKKKDRRTLRNSVVAGLAKETLRRSFEDLECQGLVDMKFSLANINLLPESLTNKLLEICTSLWAKTKNWMQLIVDLTKEFFATYGTLIIIVIGVILMKFADRVFGSSTWWSIFSFTCVYLMNLWNSNETDKLEERILNLQNLADTYEKEIACSKELSKDNPFLGLKIQGDDGSFTHRVIQTITCAFGFDIPDKQSCNKFMTFCKMTTITASAFRTWRDIFMFLSTWALKIYAYFFGDEETRSLMSFGPKSLEVVEWMKTVKSLNTEERRREIALDPDLHEQIFAAQKLGHQYWAEAVALGNAKLESTVRYICTVIDSLAKEAEIAKLAKRVRFDPLCIRMIGSPGIGKSSCITMLGEKLYERYGAPRLNWLHSRTAGQKWWDDYLRQKVILYDDPFALAGVSLEDAIKELFSVKTNAPYIVPQASCPLKGMHFEGEIILITCNEPGLDLNGIAFTPQAVYRRFDYQVTAYLKKEFCGGKPQNKVTKADVKRVPEHIRNVNGHLEFQRSDPEDNHAPIGARMDWNELLVEASLEFEDHIRGQANVLRMNKTRYPVIVEKLMKEDAEAKLAALGDEGFINLNLFREGTEDHHSVLDEQCKESDKQLLASIKALRVGTHTDKAIKTTEWLFAMVSSAWSKAKAFLTEHPLGLILLGGAASIGAIAVEEFISNMIGGFFGSSKTEENPYKPIKVGDKTISPMDDQYEELCAAHWFGFPMTTKGVEACFRKHPDAIDKWKDDNFGYEIEMEPSGDSVTRRSKRVKIRPRKNVFKALRVEASIDPNAHELVRHRLPQNMFTVEHQTVKGPAIKMRATAIGGRVLLLPRHFFVGYTEGSIITVSDGVTVFSEKIRKDKVVEVPDRDIAAYEMTAVFPLQKRISHLFIKEDAVEKITTAKGALFLKDGQYGLVEFGVLTPVDYQDSAKYTNDLFADELEEYRIRRGWSLDVSTSVGDCGAMILVFDTHAQKKLVGMHVAGKQNLSVSELVTEELVADMLSHFASSSGLLGTTDLDEKFLDAEGESLLQIQGNFTPVGVTTNAFALRQPDKTDIMPSILHDLIVPHETEPSVLRPNDPRCKVEGSPLARGVEKYGTPPGMFDLEISDFAIRDSNQSMLKVLKWPRAKKRDSVISIDTVLLGDGSATHKINTKSSPGWPLIHQSKGRTGKKWLLNSTSEGEMIMTDQCKDVIISALDSWTRYERHPESVWSDCLKGEQRSSVCERDDTGKIVKLCKVCAGDTRVFTIAPLAFTLAGRVLCIDFMTAYHAAHLKFSSAVGMDPESFDWELLLRRMEEVGTQCFDGDYKKFDSMLPPELMYRAMELISDFYDLYIDSLEFSIGSRTFKWTSQQMRLIRRVIVDELIHTRSLSLNLVYQKHQGNPSGNFLTTPMNTIVNDYYGRIGFYTLVRESGRPLEVGLFDKHIRMIAYGDDNVFTVDSEMAPLFNFVTYRDVLARAGITYTPADKSGDSIALKPLSEMRFLKRGVSDWGWIRVPTIEKKTIHGMINWVRATNEPERIEQSYVNLENAFRFAFFHGRQYFDDLKLKVNTELIRLGRHPVQHDWDMFMVEYRTRVE